MTQPIALYEWESAEIGTAADRHHLDRPPQSDGRSGLGRFLRQWPKPGGALPRRGGPTGGRRARLRRTTRDYDETGNLILITYRDADDRPAYSQLGFTKLEFMDKTFRFAPGSPGPVRFALISEGRFVEFDLPGVSADGVSMSLSFRRVPTFEYDALATSSRCTAVAPGRDGGRGRRTLTLFPGPMYPIPHDEDRRIVLTLDAGGTTLKFTAVRGNRLLLAPMTIPSEADDLSRCLANIVAGFRRLEEESPERAVAISFAFPGPADYPAGIIGDLPNFPAFRAAGGVPLGPMLEAEFGRPVFINNDGNLFAYGEAIAGYLPYVNGLLEAAGNPKRYRNLFALTLGTGLGGGVVIDGRLLVGDNSIGGEAHLLRNVLDPGRGAEEGACIRAVRRVYAAHAGIPLVDAPAPKVIADIARGDVPGHEEAAHTAFRELGEVAGDALAQGLALIDGVAVIGGGISHAHELFMPGLVAALNRPYAMGDASIPRRLIAQAYNVEDAAERAEFTRNQVRWITVPSTDRSVAYDPIPRTAVGVSRLGTSEAVAVGAYAFALQQLDA